MSVDPPGTTPSDTGYLRGVRVVDVEAGRVIRILVALSLLALLAVTIALTISAASQNSRLTRLRHQGVPVEVTATGCLGISSGIGMAIEYWECRGTYTLGGHSYNEVIRGSRARLRDGQRLEAVAVPGDPALISTATAVTKRYSPWTPYVTPIILAAVFVTLILGLVWWSKRRYRSDAQASAAP